MTFIQKWLKEMLDYDNHREKVHAHYFASIMELDPEVLTGCYIGKGKVLGRKPERTINCPLCVRK